MTADHTNNSRELGNLRYLAGHSQIVQLLDDFIHQGPNGTHQCLVFELLGPTIDFIIADIYGLTGSVEDGLEPETILRLSEQLLQALELIHEADYAHGGTDAVI